MVQLKFNYFLFDENCIQLMIQEPKNFPTESALVLSQII